jgi:hypothetical protein
MCCLCGGLNLFSIDLSQQLPKAPNRDDLESSSNDIGLGDALLLHRLTCSNLKVELLGDRLTC